jgi:hypothetical protein
MNGPLIGVPFALPLPIHRYANRAMTSQEAEARRTTGFSGVCRVHINEHGFPGVSRF